MSTDLNIEKITTFYGPGYCDSVLQELLEYKYQDLNLLFNGKSYTPRRKMLAFSDPGLSYTFSGTTIVGELWTSTLLDIKRDVEKKTGREYNFVLLNYYPDGFAKINAHRDNEEDLDPSSDIPTLSFGSRRIMMFHRKGCPSQKVTLENGSLLLMKSPTNQFWTHEIVADATIEQPRISLTFRKIVKTPRKRTFEESFSSEASTSKRVSPQDPIPDDDWLTKMYSNAPSPPTKSVCLKEWNFGFGFIVSVHQLDTKLFLHMRQYSTTSATTSRGIIMNAPTFQDFSRKIYKVDLKYASSSQICNNQLAIFSKEGELVFAQIFHFEEFKLKQGSLTVDYVNVTKIRELIDEITEFIKVSLLENVLPAKILQHSDEKLTHSLDLHCELMTALRKELKINVYKLFQCDACAIDDPCQFNHECMLKNYEDLRYLLGDDALLMINVKNVIDDLKCKNVLQYFNKEFFETLSYEELKNEIML